MEVTVYARRKVVVTNGCSHLNWNSYVQDLALFLNATFSKISVKSQNKGINQINHQCDSSVIQEMIYGSAFSVVSVPFGNIRLLLSVSSDAEGVTVRLISRFVVIVEYRCTTNNLRMQAGTELSSRSQPRSNQPYCCHDVWIKLNKKY